MQGNVLEERINISYKQARKLSQEKIKDGMIIPDQSLNFQGAKRAKEEGKEIQYFKTGEKELVGYRIKGLTDQLINNWKLTTDQLWAIQRYEIDYTLTQLTNHSKTNLASFFGSGGQKVNDSITDIKIDAIKRLDKIYSNFTGNKIRLVLLNDLIISGYSLRAMKQKHKKDMSTIKNRLIEAIEILEKGYIELFNQNSNR
jgi:hypothetical protein